MVMTKPGRVSLTPRDAAALAWIGEQYGCREDVVGEVLSRLTGEAPLSKRAVRNITTRWAQAGWVERRPLFGGRMWVIPTTTGLEVGRRGDQAQPLELWRPAGSTLAHVHACALVRLHVEGAGVDADWCSERLLRRANQPPRGEKRSGPPRRIPDAEAWLALPKPEPGKGTERVRALVEVELHVKDESRYADMVSRYDTSRHALVWFAPEELGRRLIGVLGRVGAQNVPGGTTGRRVEVLPLPEVLGIAYESAP